MFSGFGTAPVQTAVVDWNERLKDAVRRGDNDPFMQSIISGVPMNRRRHYMANYCRMNSEKPEVQWFIDRCSVIMDVEDLPLG